MSATEHLEIELKFDVDAGASAPDLRVLPGVVGATEPETFELNATYYDTENLDLAGNRVTLRRRTGGNDAGWHLKRPAGTARRELVVGFDDAPADGEVPAVLVDPVRVLTRNRPLIPVAAIATSRRMTEYHGADGSVLALLCEDLVTARSMLPGGEAQQWTEWEFELVDGDTKLLKSAAKALRAAGAREASAESKLARAIGETPVVSTPRLSKNPTALELLVVDIAEHRDALITYDPQVRVDAYDAVHQMRVASRKLRSLFSAFPRVLDPARTARVSAELKLLAGILGAARDAEVQIEIYQTLLADHDASDELVDALVGAEERRHERALRAAISAMSSDRYFALLDSVDGLVADPPAGPDADLPAAEAVQQAVRRSVKKVEKAQDLLAKLPEWSPEWIEQLHDIRKRAKRVRYTAEAAEALHNKKIDRAARAAKRIQSALGDFNDFSINREKIAEVVAADQITGRDMFILGRIDAQQAAQSDAAVAEYWKAAKDL